MSEKKKKTRASEEDDLHTGLDEDSVANEPETSWEDLADDPELATRVFEAIGGMIPGVFKKVAVSGVGNLLLSEDGIRALLSDNKKLPKEAVGLLVGQADAMRREILRIISREIRIFLENVDFGGELSKILTSVSFEIKTEIRFIPNDQGVKAQAKKKGTSRRGAAAATPEGGEREEDQGEGEEAPPASSSGKERSATPATPAHPEGGAAREAAKDAAKDAAKLAARTLRWGLRRREEEEDEG